MFNSQRWRELLAAVTDPAKRARLVATLGVLIAALGGVTIAVVDNGPDHGPGKPRGTIEIHVGSKVAVDGPDADTKRDDTLTITRPAAKVANAAAAAPERFDVGGDMRGHDPTPAGVVRGPLASQEWPGCKTAFVRSFSQRTSPIRAIALHYTAGGNVAGWGDVDGLTAFSNNIANQVSWAFNIDREGNCAYTVPITQKAWTISGLNSQTVNIEVVGRGNEPSYAGDGFAKLAAVVRRIASIEHLPLRLGATDGQCHVTRPGIITHWMGGPCSGGHSDIKPFSIQAVIDGIAASAKASSPTSTQDRKHLTRWEAGKVSCLETARRHGRRPNTHAGHWKGHAGDHRKAIACRAPLERRRAHLKGTKHDARYRAIGRVLAA